MPYTNITEFFARTISCPVNRGKIEYQDCEIPGLILEVRESGLKTFAFRYRDDKEVQRQYRIGGYPNISTQLARRDAGRLLEEWCRGSYPDQVEQKPGLKPHQKRALERARLEVADAFGEVSCSINIRAPSL